MFNNWSSTDRLILRISAVLLLLSLYLLYDDRLLYYFETSSESPQIGSFKSTERDVRQKQSRQLRWRSAFSDHAVHLGDSVFTGPSSSASISLNAGGKVLIPENSLITFSQVGSQLSLDLKFGSISGQLNGDLKVKIQGEDITLSGDKTSFQVDSNGAIRALEGTLKTEPPRLIQKAKEKGTDSISINTLPEIFYHFDRQQIFNLSWSTKGYFSRYKIQLSEDKEFTKLLLETPMQKKSFSTQNYPSDGQLFIRVSGDDTDGKTKATSQPFSINFKSVSKPVLIQPTPGQTINAKANFSGKVDSSTAVIVSWSYSVTNRKFDLEISRNEDFSDRFIQKIVTGTSYKSNDLPAGTFYFRIKDHELNNPMGPWSAPASVNVLVDIPDRLAAPEILTKNIKHVLPQKSPPQIRWKPVAEATKYQIKIIELDSKQVIKQQMTTKTSFDWTEKSLGQFEVQVTAVAPDESQSPESTTGLNILTVRPVISPVTPLVVLGKSPEDPGDPKNFDLNWTETPLAEKYEVEISDNEKFENPKSIESTETSKTVTIESPGDYFWRVKPMNAQGKPLTRPSEYGMIKYDLKVPLATPILLEPLNEITVYFQKTVLTNQWFTWKPVRQAELYFIEVATDREFSKIAFTAQTKINKILITDRLPQAPLYWRVRATGDGDRVSNWSITHSLTILSGRIPAGRR